MNRIALYAVFLLAAASIALGQSTPAAQGPEATTGATIHGVIPVTLVKPLDSKKLKEGDEVTGKTLVALHASSGVDIPLGSPVIGHVTQSKARSKGDSEASLGIAFDKIQLPGGKDMPIKGVLQAVGPNPSAGSGPDTGSGPMGANSLNSGNGSTAPMATGMGPQAAQQPGGGKMLNPHSTGVVGIKNLQLENSVLSSSGKEVKLDSGSQMMVKIE
jgi:hypothetical protein